MQFGIGEVLVLLLLLCEALAGSVPGIAEGVVGRVVEGDLCFGDLHQDIVSVNAQQDVEVLKTAGLQFSEQFLQLLVLFLSVLDVFWIGKGVLSEKKRMPMLLSCSKFLLLRTRDRLSLSRGSKSILLTIWL